MTAKSSDVLAAWETSSAYWNKHQALIEHIYKPLTRALIEAAQIGAGQAVLDIGGGAGEPSLSLATVVGNSGHVTYTDPTAGMVKAARTEAERRGLTNIEFHQCPAENLPFPDNSFDVAVGRLSTMFFTDPLAGLREILRVTKPGGRVSFLVWSLREANPFFSVVAEILDRFVPTEPEDEDAPAAFRFAAPQKLAKILQQAGAVQVREQTMDFNAEAPIDAERFWEFRTEMSDTFRTKLAQLSPARTSEVRTAVIEASAPFFKTGNMNFPSQSLIVSGRKPQV